ncbi:uncharacterized protein [Onthophagus taurus]|uniref:uncharacterized protein n=1 Tax=Onthophagus taurus TaxID=166361 RepID=UPI000C20CDCC|nr:uncharacterized protein LOC111426388 [Onthophagus taurus]
MQKGCRFYSDEIIFLFPAPPPLLRNDDKDKYAHITQLLLRLTFILFHGFRVVVKIPRRALKPPRRPRTQLIPRHRIKMIKFLQTTIILSCLIVLNVSLPTSIVEEVKDNDIRNFKVKRAHDSQPQPGVFYKKPTAIKRDTTRNEQLVPNWGANEVYPNLGGLTYIGSNDYSDEKALTDYEKAYKHAENQVKLDEALRNAILKSEIYGEPTSMNPYRYYVDDQKKRKRREAPKNKLKYERVKRDTELNPEEILTVLSLLDKERQRNPSFDNDLNNYLNQNYFNGISDDEETWLDGPVYPHVSHSNKNSKYYYEKPTQIYGKYPDVFESKPKRFKIAKRKNDPTKELRYLNGPSVNDYYTLAQLLNNQREPNVPVYHRAVL